MKKKILIVGIALVLLLIGVIVIVKINLNNNIKVDIDYSNLSEEEVFYREFRECLGDSIYTNCINVRNFDENYRILFRVLDKQFNPIPGAKVLMMDSYGKPLLDITMNDNGEYAICGLENDSTYYFQQTETKDGFVVDSTVYRTKTDSERKTFVINFFNSDTDILEEEKNKLSEKFYENEEKKDSSNEEIKTVVLNSEEAKSNSESTEKDMATYIFYKNELAGLKLEVYKNEVSTKKDYNLNECSIHIDNCEITNVHVEDLYDDTDLVHITDKDGNNKNDFQNNENFYVKYNYKNYDDEIKYKITITFKYKNKVYKVSKMVPIGNDGQYKLYGQIKAYFKDEEGKPLNGAKATLKRIYQKSDTEELMVCAVEVGDSGVLTFYKLPEGTYKLIKNYNDENLAEKIIEVKSGEMTEIDI